jgi:hypothetical protein
MTIPPATKPRLGIWWDTGKTITALTHPPTENVTRTGTLLDSNLFHADEWPGVAKKRGRTTEDEYSSLPWAGFTGRGLADRHNPAWPGHEPKTAAADCPAIWLAGVAGRTGCPIDGSLVQ